MVDAAGGAGLGAANDSIPPPPMQRVTLRDIDGALARNEIACADTMARSLTSAGADGPDARAIVAWCAISAGSSTDPAALETCIAALERVLTGDPACVRAIFYRARVLERLGRTDAAIRDLRRVVRLAPGHTEARYELRMHEMHREQALEARQNTTTETRIPAAPKGPIVSSGPTSAPSVVMPRTAIDEESVRSGLRRLLAQVTWK